MSFPDIYRIDILKVTAETRYSIARSKDLAIYIEGGKSSMDVLPATMSVRDMGRLLGLQKVDSYWLVHKGFFKIILVGGKMRVVTESFEHWYAGQVKYRKVNGDPPGERLRQESYSARDIAEMLQINEQYVYEVMKKAGIEPVIIDCWKRFPRAAFDAWYAGQTRFRNAEDRKRDAEAENASLSMPDMARVLDIPRDSVYSILNSNRGKEILKVIVIADRKRITKESFDRWYANQTEYLKPEDRILHSDAKDRHYLDCLTGKKVRYLSCLSEISGTNSICILSPNACQAFDICF